MPKDRFPVNVLDPKDVEAKMPAMKVLLDTKRQELEALAAQVAFLERIVGTEAKPAKRSGISTAAGGRIAVHSRKAAPAQDRAVRALEKAGRPMGPTMLYNFMVDEGMDVPDNSNTLGANLWAAARAGRIVKVPNGVYTLPGAPVDQQLTDYGAAANGFPVSAKAAAGGEGEP